ncbi:DNA photolyase family protein [bacterium]|nr:DNA photolyase family protein [bacterium]
MNHKKNIIYWFRRDLRLSDNPALSDAANAGAIIPVFIFDELQEDYTLGSASRCWQNQSLNSLNNQLSQRLLVFIGDSKEIILKLAKESDSKTVYCNRCYEPWQIELDSKIKSILKEENIDLITRNGSLLWEPWTTLKKDGSPYKVFTPYFKNRCLSLPEPRKPIPKPTSLIFANISNKTAIKGKLILPKEFSWEGKIKKHCQIGEKAASDKLDNFLKNGISSYKDHRNYPSKKNISKLSPHLHFGEISPNIIWHRVRTSGQSEDLDHYVSELGWREFSYNLIYHFPQLPKNNLQTKFDRFPWVDNSEHLNKWQKGETGYPIIDAGMRELWETGFMHNRLRMIVGSFLVKNLLIHWHYGKEWFWDCLVDADLASNSASWQWVAGCGADAAPYFRIFNPITQGKKFDPFGEYTRKFVPELRKLPNKYLFTPWEAPSELLVNSGIKLGKDYPYPIVDLKNSRESALVAYYSISTKQK